MLCGEYEGARCLYGRDVPGEAQLAYPDSTGCFYSHPTDFHVMFLLCFIGDFKIPYLGFSIKTSSNHSSLQMNI